MFLSLQGILRRGRWISYDFFVFVVLAFGVVCRRSLGASGALNDCNAAKSSCAGLSDTSCIRSIPSHLAFTALKPFIPPGGMLYRGFSVSALYLLGKRYVIPRGGASVWCFGGSVFFTAGFCAAVVFCSASPLAPKGTRLSLKMPAAFPKVNRRMRWRGGVT